MLERCRGGGSVNQVRTSLLAVGVTLALTGGAAGALHAHGVRSTASRLSSRHVELARCPKRSPTQLGAETWTPAKTELAPPGASAIRLCRYSGLNAHPPLTLA